MFCFHARLNKCKEGIEKMQYFVQAIDFIEVFLMFNINAGHEQCYFFDDFSASPSK